MSEQLSKKRTAYFTVENPLEAGAKSVAILFGFPNGNMENPTVTSPNNEPLEPADILVDGNLVKVNWRDKLVPYCEKFEVSIETTDEPLFLIKSYWSDELLALDEDTENAPSFADTNFEDPKADDKFPIKDSGKGKVPVPKKSCKDFFKEYDARFLSNDVRRNPDMTTEQKEERIETVGRVARLLVGRRDARAAAARNRRLPRPADLSREYPPPVPGTTADPENLRDDVEHLSDSQLALFKECFPDGTGGIDLEAFQRCFERFANGELRNPANPGEREPNGGFFFLFAEFAFLAVTLSVDSGEWSELLRTFVKTQEIFIEAYHPPNRNPRLDDYGPRHFAKRKQVSEKRKRELREKYDNASPGELERHARDVMRRAQLYFF